MESLRISISREQLELLKHYQATAHQGIIEINSFKERTDDVECFLVVNSDFEIELKGE